MTLGDVIGQAILKHANQKGPNPEPMWRVIERDVNDWLAKGVPISRPEIEPIRGAYDQWPESPDPAEGLGALLEKEKL